MQSFPTKTRKGSRIAPLMTPFQHHTGSSSSPIRQEKVNRYTNRGRRNKTGFISRQHDYLCRKPKRLNKKPFLKLISNNIQIAKYMVNMQKSIDFLYISNDQVDLKFKMPSVPNFQDLMPDNLRQNLYNNNRNKLHNKCNVPELS